MECEKTLVLALGNHFVAAQPVANPKTQAIVLLQPRTPGGSAAFASRGGVRG